MNKFKNMFQYGNFQKRIIVTFIEFVITVVAWIVIEQYLTYSLFDNAIAKENIQLVLFLSILMLIKVITHIAEGILNCMLRHHLQRDFSHYARNDIFSKIIHSKIEFFDKTSTGELFELAMNDSDNFATFFTQNGLQMTVAFLRAATYFVILLFTNVKLSLCLIVTYLIGYIALIISNKKTILLIKEIRQLNISITKWITEQINGFEVIKSSKIEEQRLEKMQYLINQYSEEMYKLEKTIRKYILVYDIFSILAIAIVASIGGMDILRGTITYGSLMIFVNATSAIKKECDNGIKYIERLNKSYISFIKILKFNEEYKQEDDDGTLKLDKIKKIEFKDVNFSYHDNKSILKNINLEINSEEKIAFIGKTGSGKTTLVNLLCRFYNLKKGEIKINQIDYKTYKMSELREQIGYVLQDVVIFKGNVFENINYANKKISEEEIINICKKLNLHNKIISFEDGYNTDLSKNQDLLSQGEKQLINFARILVENPSVIILDEVTSSLSYENEELMKNAIKEIMKGRICFIIAHRLSTIKDCNKIVILEEGKVIESGTHRELLEKQGAYYNLINA